MISEVPSTGSGNNTSMTEWRKSKYKIFCAKCLLYNKIIHHFNYMKSDFLIPSDGLPMRWVTCHHLNLRVNAELLYSAIVVFPKLEVTSRKTFSCSIEI